MTIAVVGAGLGGLTVIEALRSGGVDERIVIIGDENHDPYSRPSLSKQVISGTWEPQDAALRSPQELAPLHVERIVGTASKVGWNQRTVTVGKSAIGWDRLVIATGVRPRRLPAALGPSYALRTLDDVARLREVLAGRRHVAIVGAGILSCELASVLAHLGHRVTVIGRSTSFTFGNLGDVISDRIADLLTGHGIDVRLGVAPVTRDADGLLLSDGNSLRADVLIGAIGCEPDTGWLQGGELDLSDGVVCGPDGVAAAGVWALGDIAAWPDTSGSPRRVEHQQTTIEQAHAVARSMQDVGTGEPVEPFFWSDLCGTKILVHGRVDPHDELIRVAGEDQSREVLASRRNGRIRALIGWNAPREFRLARAELIEAHRTALEMS